MKESRVASDKDEKEKGKPAVERIRYSSLATHHSSLNLENTLTPHFPFRVQLIHNRDAGPQIQF